MQNDQKQQRKNVTYLGINETLTKNINPTLNKQQNSLKTYHNIN
jgi:hypothetical protein